MNIKYILRENEKFLKKSEDELLEEILYRGFINMEDENIIDFYMASTNTAEELIEGEIPNLENLTMIAEELLEGYTIRQETVDVLNQEVNSVFQNLVNIKNYLATLKTTKNKQDVLKAIGEEINKLLQHSSIAIEKMTNASNRVAKDVEQTMQNLVAKNDEETKRMLAISMKETKESAKFLSVIMTKLYNKIYRQNNLDSVVAEVMAKYAPFIKGETERIMADAKTKLDLFRDSLVKLINIVNSAVSQIDKSLRFTAKLVEATEKAEEYLNTLKNFEATIDWNSSGALGKLYMMKDMFENWFIKLLNALPSYFMGMVSFSSILLSLATKQREIDMQKQIFASLATKAYNITPKEAAKMSDAAIDRLLGKMKQDTWINKFMTANEDNSNKSIFGKIISVLSKPIDAVKGLFGGIMKIVKLPFTLISETLYSKIMNFLDECLPALKGPFKKLLSFIGSATSAGFFSAIGLVGFLIGTAIKYLSIQRQKRYLRLFLLKEKQNIEHLIKNYGNVPKVQELKEKYEMAKLALEKSKKSEFKLVKMVQKFYNRLVDKIEKNFGRQSFLYKAVVA